MSFKDITDAEAKQFAVMFLAGVPPSHAVKYFFPEDTSPEELAHCARTWTQAPRVAKAITELQGKNWIDMEPQERIKTALEKHYNEMAFFIYHNPYGDLDDKKLAKADKCRDVLEKKLAGQAGVADPLTQLYQDMLAGKVPVTGNVKVALPKLPQA
jgi:hypothetical protein